MTLNLLSNHPSTRSYVLKLHRDAMPRCGRIAGRLENMASGRSFEFGTGEQLLDCLMQDLAIAAADAAEAP